MMIKQESKCLNTLSKKDRFKTVFEYSYDEENNSKLVGNFDNFFLNKDSTNCPVKQCTLKQEACFVNYEDVHLQLSNQFPFQFTAYIDKPAGYDTAGCFECTNGYQTMTYDNIQVKQNPIGSIAAVYIIIIIVIIIIFFIIFALYFNGVKKDH